MLQTRIPEQLDDELRDRAEQLGTSVSTVVRNVLLHTFDLVEGVVTDSSQIARVLMEGKSAHSRHEREAEEVPEVIGWQEAILNKNGVCDQCNAILPLGQRAALGVPTGPRAILLCLDCLAMLSPDSDESSAQPASNKSAARTPKRKSRSRKKTSS